VGTRLTLWYLAVLCGALGLYALATLLIVHLWLHRDLDRSLRAEDERMEALLREGPGGLLLTSSRGIEREVGSLVEVWSTRGALLYRSERLGERSLGEAPVGPVARMKTSYATRDLGDSSPWRVIDRTHRVDDGYVLIRVALSERRMLADQRKLSLALLLGLPLTAALAALGGHWLARRSLAPLDRMARHAERLSAETLGERIPVDNPDDELGHLARVFNTSFERIERSFAALRQFVADVSHELRTPLTAIRSLGEVRLAKQSTLAECRDTIATILEESDRLTLLVETLLAISRAEGGQVRLEIEDVDLLELAREVAAHLGVLAEERDQTLLVEGEQETLVEADRTVLRQALVNIVDNAIKYSPRQAPVRIAVGTRGPDACVEIADRGPGIPAAHRERIFDRFYRVDAGRSREEGGVGLGLWLARWAVTAHRGRIELETEEGQGSTFRILLPRPGKQAPV
jgi:heavy metal sensor kinase